MHRELDRVHARVERHARWPEERPTDAPPLRLVVAPGVPAAAAVLAEFGFAGPPEVARTISSLRTAVVPLPRLDPLLVEHGPPRTWLVTLRHEAAHLLAVDRPGLRAAPVWFQEGWAEALAVFEPDPWTTQGIAFALLREEAPLRPLEAALGALPAEALLDGRRHWAEAALAADSGPRPWLQVRGWSVADFLREARPRAAWSGPTQRGREFDPPGRDGWFLLATYPGETADFLLDGAWDGAPLRLDYRHGRHGRGEAGLLLEGGGERRVRVRLTRGGGIAASLEEAGAVRRVPLAGEGFASGAEQHRVELRVEDDELIVTGPRATQRLSLGGAAAPPFVVRAYVGEGILMIRP